MKEQAVHFRLGLFVLGSLIILGVLIVFFGRKPTLLKSTEVYVLRFDNAPGVVTGTPVRRSGVKIGEVERVHLDEQSGKVLVRVQIDRPHGIRRGDQATLRQGLFGSNSVIDFVQDETAKQSERSREAVKPGTTVDGVTQVNAAAVMQKADKVLPPAEEAMKDMSKVLKRFEKMFPLMEDTLKEFRDVAKGTKEILPAVKETSKELNELVKSARKEFPQLKRTNDEVQLAARNWSKVGERVDVLLQSNEKKIVKALDDLTNTLEEISKLVSEKNRKAVEDILKNVQDGSKRLDSISKNADLLLNDSRKTLDRLVDSIEKADKVFTNLEKITKPLSERSDDILKNLDGATAKLNKAMGEFREWMKVVSQSQGTVYKLLNDPTLYNRLNDAVYTATKVFPRLDKILRDVEVFTDKIARHPELLGVGGAVRPSSGLKSMPPYPIVPENPPPIMWKSHPGEP